MPGKKNPEQFVCDALNQVNELKDVSPVALNLARDSYDSCATYSVISHLTEPTLSGVVQISTTFAVTVFGTSLGVIVPLWEKIEAMLRERMNDVDSVNDFYDKDLDLYGRRKTLTITA